MIEAFLVRECCSCVAQWWITDNTSMSQTNEVAHTLTRVTAFLTSPHTFIDVTPHIIELISSKML